MNSFFFSSSNNSSKAFPQDVPSESGERRSTSSRVSVYESVFELDKSGGHSSEYVAENILRSGRQYLESLQYSHKTISHSLTDRSILIQSDNDFPRFNAARALSVSSMPSRDSDKQAVMKILGDGVVFDVLTEMKPGTLVTTISESSSNNIYYYTEYNEQPDGRWISSINKSSIIPSKVDKPNLFLFNIAAAIGWIGLGTANGNHSKQKKGQKLQSTDCFSHDFKCTTPINPQGRLFSNDGSEIRLWFPCSGTIGINVLDCCKQHDIDLWCSTSRMEAAWSDFKVVSCIMAQIATQGFWKLKTLCILSGVDLTVLLFYLSVTVLTNILGPLFSWAFDAADLLDLNLKHQDSCLCGGTKPTVLCGDSCKDMCKETNKREDCYNCGWKCKKDAFGAPVGIEPDVSSNMPCCPGTDTANPTLRQKCGYESRSDAIARCKKLPCDQCYFQCEWNSNILNPQLYWRYYGVQRKGAVCCEPVPKLPKIPCEFNGQQFK